jgi:hypothetical protein
MSPPVCSRCGRNLKDKGVLLLAKLCAPCFNTLLASRDEKLWDFLDFLDRPAALLARDHTVLFSNSRFRRKFRKFDHDVVGLRIGEIFGCKHAAAPGRCGETVYCLHCQLERVLELAWISGERLSDTRASLLHRSGARKTYTVTTQKAGDAVLLMIRER